MVHRKNTSTTGHPTRQAVLIGWAHKHMQTAGLEPVQFADTMAAEYEARVPAEHRGVALRTIAPDTETGDAYFRIRDANRKCVERWLSGAVRVPAEIEEAWVAALAEPWRGHCLTDLASRHGLLAVRLSMDHPALDLCRVADFIRECGEDLRALAPLLDRGFIAGGDTEQVNEAIRELRETQGVIVGLVHKLKATQAKVSGAPVVPLGKGRL